MKASKESPRILITGGDGFVAQFAVTEIVNLLPQAQILLTARKPLVGLRLCETAILDVCNQTEVENVLAGFRPTHVLHLAGIASRRAAEADPVAAWRTNATASIGLAKTLKAVNAGAAFIFASTSQVYDSNSQLPITEETNLAPVGVYASSKAAADLAIAEMAGGELQVIRFRPFNHTGPGQSPMYAFGSFANQIVAIEGGKKPPIMAVGDLSLRRDFSDVRDIARAYALAVSNSSALPRSSLFNLAAGQSISLGELLGTMLRNTKHAIEIRRDPALGGQNEPAVIIGSSRKARELLGWQCAISFEQTMADMVEAARRVLD